MPIQIKLLPVTDKFSPFAYKLKDKLENEGLRVEVDDSNETISKRIRNAEVEKFPILLF